MTNIRVITNKPVAYDSPDHMQPHGTANDNSENLAFNWKLHDWIPKTKICILDLGCSGGGFVKSIIDSGGFAIGIEGSDYSKLRQRAEWANIPQYLFTADITEPFQIVEVDDDGNESPLKFNVITAWEVIEHLKVDQIAQTFDNISRHLADNGVIIMSVCPIDDVIDGINLHQTVQEKAWWIDLFTSYGYKNQPRLIKYFNRDWIRNDFPSFHVVLTRNNEVIPYHFRFYFASLWNNQSFLKIREILRSNTPIFIKSIYRRLKNHT